MRGRIWSRTNPSALSQVSVLRGGLTQKHVDPSGLLAILEFEPRSPAVLEPQSGGSVESRYETPAREFELSVVAPRHDRPFDSGPRDRVEILLCSEGAVSIEGDVASEAASLAAGASAVIAAAAGAYRLAGQGTVYRATVPSAIRTGSR